MLTSIARPFFAINTVPFFNLLCGVVISAESKMKSLLIWSLVMSTSLAIGPIRYSRYKTNYGDILQANAWGFFPNTCHFACNHYPRYSVSYWMASGEVCPENIGLDEVKASNSFVIGDVCAGVIYY